MLRILREMVFQNIKKIIYFDTHIIEKTLRGKNISSFLMQEAIKQINKKTLAILRCNKKLEKYYRNYKWKNVSNYIKFNDNKKLTPWFIQFQNSEKRFYRSQFSCLNITSKLSSLFSFDDFKIFQK